MTITEIHQLFLTSGKVSTDTRNIEKGVLFFALKGENFNGNTFALQALEKGASYAIVDEDVAPNNPKVILVTNVLNTLQQLATYHRNYLRVPIVALTGSNGKTTTKELINAVLSQQFKTTATKGNLNNHIGVPLTLLSMNRNTEIGIVEMGANHQKEIELLCNIAQPDYGVITNFGRAHLEGFGGVKGVIKGKSELYDYLKENNKIIFFNVDDTIQYEKLKSYSNTYSFGKENATIAVTFLDANPFVNVAYKEETIQSNLIGSYNFTNLAIAIAIGRYFKISSQEIKTGIEGYAPSNNRSQIIEKGGNKIILDAYNANPSSMEAAIENFSNLKDQNKVAILGDMFELGNDAPKEHQHIANLAAKLNIETLLVGDNFYAAATTLLKFSSFEDLRNYIEQHPLKNKTLLIKGSRGMALERVLELL
jgi:UDP-N-acetylmuramoyl-tripeptide--D-alanyl-D-alanine ligase